MERRKRGGGLLGGVGLGEVVVEEVLLGSRGELSEGVVVRGGHAGCLYVEGGTVRLGVELRISWGK